MRNNGPITVAIRNAIINNTDRGAQYEEIITSVGCTRDQAKELYFAFLYHATEEFLTFKLQGATND